MIGSQTRHIGQTGSMVGTHTPHRADLVGSLAQCARAALRALVHGEVAARAPPAGTRVGLKGLYSTPWGYRGTIVGLQGI